MNGILGDMNVRKTRSAEWDAVTFRDRASAAFDLIVQRH